MVTNFKKHTEELTDIELKLVSGMIEGFKRYGKDNPIKSADIVRRFNERNPHVKLTDVRLRKICNYIRTNRLLPVIATSNGYYVSYDINEIRRQAKSLRERVHAILKSAEGLDKIADEIANGVNTWS